MNAPRLFILLLVGLLVPALVRADSQLLTPDGVAASSQQSTSPADRLIDGSGIVGYNGQTAIALDSVHQNSLLLSWAASPNDPMPRLTYLWETPQEVCGLVLWQAIGSLGVKDFLLTAFDEAGNALGTWSFVAVEVEDVAGAGRDIPPQFFPIASEEAPVAGVSQIVLDVRSNYGGSFTALSETHITKPPDEPREGEYCVVDKRSRSRWHVPADQKDQDLWFRPGYDDGRWFQGGACLGYETSPLCDDLIVYLTMDTANVVGTNVLDTSNSPIVHDGVRVGSVPVVPARVQQGLSFPGDQQNFVQIRHQAELNPDSAGYSVGVWVFPQEAQAAAGIIAFKQGATGGSGWGIVVVGDVTRVSMETTSGQVRSVDMPRLPAGQWSHVGFVADRVNQKFTGYLNGAPQGSVPLVATDVVTNSAAVNLLQTPVISDFGYRAILDEFAIWKRALPEEEVQAVYDAGVQGQSFKDTGAANGLYAGLIETNVGPQMRGINSTIWERIGFNLNSTTGIKGMVLRMHYDDGFVCYLNGVEVARRNAPSTPSPLSFQAAAAGPRDDNLALAKEIIPLDSFVNLLVTGQNVLAIHGLNEKPDADRFVIWPELCLDLMDCRGRNNGTDFWVTFPANFATDPSNPKEISVCITGIAGTTGRVEMPRLGVSIPFTVGATGAAKVFLSPILAELSGSDVIEDKGVHITAQRPVSVVGLNHIDFSTDGFLALPTRMLGTEHLVLGYPNVWDGVPVLNGTEFGLVATTDGTKVQIIPSVETDGHPAGVPYYIDLDQGQTYQLINTETGTGDLSGTAIRSNQPIGLFAGHRCANVRGGEFFCDHVVEHIPAVKHWRNRYFLGPLATRLNGDTVRVLAAQDATQVFFNGLLHAVLNRGEVYERIVTIPTEVTTNGPPVLVAQVSNSSDYDGVEDADPFMALVPPPEAWASAYRICAPPTSGFDKNFLNLTLVNAALGATTVDGVALFAIPGITISPIGATGLLHVVVPISSSSPHDVFGPAPFGVIAYGFASYNFDSYGYPGGISFRDIPPTVRTPPERTYYTSSQNPTVPAPNIAGVSTVEDNCDPPGSLSTTQTPREGTALAPGTHVVSVYSTDSSGFTGVATTLITVLPSWQQANFPQEYGNPETEATIWGWSADPDQDGDDNKKEWQLGGDPNDRRSRSVSGVFGGEMLPAGGLRVLCRRRFNDPNVTYLEEGSEDLINWVSGPNITALISSEIVYPGGEYEDVVIEAIPTTLSPPPPRYYLRIVADGCPPP